MGSIRKQSLQQRCPRVVARLSMTGRGNYTGRALEAPCHCLASL